MRLWFGLFTLVAALAFSNGSQARDYSIVDKFQGSKGDGGVPRAGLVADPSGNLFGTTYSGGGGTGCSGEEGCGTVFKLAPDDSETILYRFTGGNDGGSPRTNLIRDKQGNLYGTTTVGGTGTQCQGGCGIAFKILPDGTEKVLYSFQGGNDGADPQGLTRDADGNLYGVTEFGGGDGCEGYGCGTIFELIHGKTESILHAFGDGADGRVPSPGLVLDKQGNLYGATGGGGGACDCGFAFKLDPAGTMIVLYTFTGGEDGNAPSGLIADKAGNLYGTTQSGGGASACGSFGCGTIFEIDSEGIESVLYRFTGLDDGGVPLAGLIMDNNANLYGTANFGGAHNIGTAFKLSSSGDLTVLHAFGTIKKDGSRPEGTLIQVGPYVYGTTPGDTFNCNGGACGTVFRVKKSANAMAGVTRPSH